MEPKEDTYYIISIIIFTIVVLLIKNLLKHNFKMNKQNRLPKYWCVKNDGSQLFKDTVIKYLNTFLERDEFWKGSDNNSYYGYTGSRIDNPRFRGTQSLIRMEYCENNPTLLTLQEFIELTTEQVKLKDKFILGKWHRVYYNSPMNDSVYYFKPLKRNDRGESIWSLHGETHHSQTDSWALNLLKSVEVLEDLTEIQQYLPDGHIDKIKQVEFKDDSNNIKLHETCWACYKTGLRYHEGEAKGIPIEVWGAKNKILFYYFKTKQRCQDYLDSIHNKSKVNDNNKVDKFISNNPNNNFTLTEIKSKLLKHYDKNDVDDIIEILTK